MKNVRDAETMQELINRIEKLQPASQRQWGKMNVGQMMAHLSNALESSIGSKMNKQVLLGKIFGKFAKKSIITDKPIKQNLPTAPGFLVTDEKEFNAEKQRLLALMKRLADSDPVQTSKNPHPFFGILTPEEWDTMNYKHIDHHLRQFNA